MPDPETLTLRVTVIAGKRYADDRRGSSIGRIMKASGVLAHLAQWSLAGNGSYRDGF